MMKINRAQVTGFARTFVKTVQEKEITFLAASLAYYAFVSLIPLLLLLIAIVSLTGASELAEQVRAVAGGPLSPSGQQLIVDAISNDTGAGGASVFALAALTWSAIKVFRGLDVAFSRVYSRSNSQGIVNQIRNALITLVAVIVGIGLTVAIGSLIALTGAEGALAEFGLGGAFGTTLSAVSLTLVLFPLYFFLPGGKITPKGALPGAAFAAVGWTILQSGFRIYAANAGTYEAYGIIGGVLLLITLLYFGGLILLLGVVLNAVIGEHTDDLAEETAPNWAERLKAGGTFKRDD
jgi:membrane protein